MRSVVRSPLISVGEVTATYADAVLLGLLTGEWTDLEARVAGGLAAEDADPPGLDAALLAFRREHRLLAAEDLRAWLSARDLTSEDLVACVGRELTRGRGTASASDAEVARVLRAQAHVDGTLARCAAALAERLVAAQALGADAPAGDPDAAARLTAAALHGPDRGLAELDDLPARALRVVALEAALGAFRSRCADDESLRRRLVDRRLALTRVRFDEVCLGTDSAAREAVLCVRVDGMGLPQVAARAGLDCALQDTELEALDPPMRAGLAGGRPGELVGPVQADTGFRVAVLRDRRSPALSDPDVRERLAREVAARRLARHAAGRVAWHGDV